MLINMDETRLRTIEQVEDFLRGSASIESSAVGEDTQRYAQSSRVLKRFDYPGRTKKGRGILRRDLQQTAQLQPRTTYATGESMAGQSPGRNPLGQTRSGAGSAVCAQVHHRRDRVAR